MTHCVSQEAIQAKCSYITITYSRHWLNLVSLIFKYILLNLTPNELKFCIRFPVVDTLSESHFLYSFALFRFRFGRSVLVSITATGLINAIVIHFWWVWQNKGIFHFPSFSESRSVLTRTIIFKLSDMHHLKENVMFILITLTIIDVYAVVMCVVAVSVILRTYNLFHNNTEILCLVC